MIFKIISDYIRFFLIYCLLILAFSYNMLSVFVDIQNFQPVSITYLEN